jgi:hypothetical protein
MMAAVAVHKAVDNLPGAVLEPWGGPFGDVGEIHALGGGRHHHAGEARPGLAQLEGQQGALAAPQPAGELRKAMLLEDHGRVGPEAPAQGGIAEQLLDQGGAAVELLGHAGHPGQLCDRGPEGA